MGINFDNVFEIKKQRLFEELRLRVKDAILLEITKDLDVMETAKKITKLYEDFGIKNRIIDYNVTVEVRELERRIPKENRDFVPSSEDEDFLKSRGVSWE